MKEKKQNRRYFIKSAILSLIFGTVVLWDKMIATQSRLDSRRRVLISIEPNKEISFQDDFIVINKDDKIKVFSSRCTHLGCKINQYVDHQLLCPCHGSTFDLEGNATKGPAFKALEEMRFEIDRPGNNIIVIP